MTWTEGGYLAGFLAFMFAVLRAARARLTMAEAAEILVSAGGWLWSLRKGRAPMVTVDAKVKVSKELGEFLQALCDVAEDVAAGKKPGDVAMGNLEAVRVAFEGASEIPVEFEADPEASITTIGAAIGRLTAIFLAAKKAKALASASPVAPVVAKNS